MQEITSVSNNLVKETVKLQQKKYRYKEGKICEIKGELKICKNGIHFCENLKDVFDYYPLVQWVKVYKVEI